MIIAGERSGVGKTTLTLAILAYLQRWSDRVQSFKVGPDYIDPMFHQYVTARPCRNLDPVLTSEAYVQACFAAHTQTAEFAVVEGVMGLFDGARDAIAQAKVTASPAIVPPSPRCPFGSTAHIAQLLGLSVLLVVDCSRLSQSIAALVAGYQQFNPAVEIVGVILNRVGSDRHVDLLRSALDSLGVPVLGVVPRQDAIAIPDRHLGLVPTAELPELDALIDHLATLAATWFEWEILLPLLRVRDRIPPATPLFLPAEAQAPVRLAIAQDAAFNFYYADNLDQLRSLGAELLPWSPLQDEALPADVQGVILGGGFPEMFAAQLSDSRAARQSLQQATRAHLPVYAECGGLMYLSQAIVGFDGQTWEMIGSLPTTAMMGKRLTLGYRHATALQPSVLVPAGATVWAHEFHRSHLSHPSDRPLWQFPTQTISMKGNPSTGRVGDSVREDAVQARLNLSQPQEGIASQPFPQMIEGWATESIHASYLHLHWGATPELPRRFLSHCRQAGWGIAEQNYELPIHPHP